MRARALVPLLAVALVAAAGTAPAVAQTGAGSISGTVTAAADGTPLAGVCVEAYGESIDTAVTASDGSFEITGLPAGAYTVAFNSCREPLAGYASEFHPDAPTGEGAEPVVLDAGEDASGVDASLDPASVLGGVVTDDVTGEPVEGVCVLAFAPEAFQFGQAVTGADGRYAVATLRAGEYIVYFQDCSDPYTYVGEAYDDVAQDAGGSGEPTPVALGEGETRDDVDAGLTQGGSLRGTLTGLHHGQPLSGVCVALVAQGADPQQPQNVTFSGYAPDPFGQPLPGEFVFPGVPAGTYDVLVNADEVCGDDGYEPADLDGPFRVEAGEVIEGADAVLAPRPSISFVCFTSAEPGPSPTFGDVRNVHAAAIECLAERGIVEGRADGTYRPAEEVSRDQMASFVARTLEQAGVPLPGAPEDAFTDDEGNTHERAINQLAELGVVTGKGGGRYAPGETVTRGQTATILVNAYQEATGLALRSTGDAFTDDEGDVHEERIDKAATAGLAAGSQGRFSPGVAVRRDQMATFVARLLDRVMRDSSLDDVFGGSVPAEPPPA